MKSDSGGEMESCRSSDSELERELAEKEREILERERDLANCYRNMAEKETELVRKHRLSVVKVVQITCCCTDRGQVGSLLTFR